MICISVGNIEMIARVNDLHPELVEIRYDLVQISPAEVNEVLNNDIRQVATCRPGKYTDEQRKELLKSAVDLGAAYIDIEIESGEGFIAELKNYADKKNCEFILSYHNYEITPGIEELKKILSQCYEKGAKIAKLACMVTSEEDSERLLSLYASEGRKVIIGMGELGISTRISATDLGSEFTFVSADSNAATAPGQLSYEEYHSIKNRFNKK